MPCLSHESGPSRRAIEYGRVKCLLAELGTGAPVNPDSPEWKGYINNFSNQNLNSATAQLCEALKEIETECPEELGRCSLELQIWWRDHKKTDAERRKKEAEEKKTQDEKDAALRKLTPHEKNLLGLDKRTRQTDSTNGLD